MQASCWQILTTKLPTIQIHDFIYNLIHTWLPFSVNPKCQLWLMAGQLASYTVYIFFNAYFIVYHYECSIRVVLTAPLKYN